MNVNVGMADEGGVGMVVVVGVGVRVGGVVHHLVSHTQLWGTFTIVKLCKLSIAGNL